VDAGGVERLAAGQGGLFTRAQARTCGLSNYQIRRRLAAGDWFVVLGPVLARGGRVVTPALRDRAALLAVEPAILCGPSAARLHGIAVRDKRTWLTVAPHHRVRLPGVKVVRELLPRGDVVMIDGVPLTARGRTVFDCLRWLPEREASELLDTALQRRWIDLDWLTARVHRFAGRHGVTRMVALVRQAGSGVRSAAERMLVTELRRAKVTGWQANMEIYDDRGDLIGIGDIVFPGLRLVIEVDGRAWHSTGEVFQRDRRRQNRLVAAGWTVLRFTWQDLTERPDEVVATVREMCRSLADRGLGSRA